MYEFFIEGEPAPQGSKRHVGHGRMIESSKRVGPWRKRIATEMAAQMSAEGLQQLGDGPLSCRLTFYMPRPKRHYRTGRYARLLKPLAPTYSHVRPDVDKLARAVLDALTMSGIVGDDQQIAILLAVKKYAVSVPGVFIELNKINDDFQID